MRKIKRLFWVALAALLVVYAGAHVFVRTDSGRSFVLRLLSRRVGMDVAASRASLSPGLALVLSDACFSASADGGRSEKVFTAPRIRLSLRCRGVRAEASGATLRAFSLGDGAWLPSIASGLGSSAVDVSAFSRISPSFGFLYFSLSGSVVEIYTDCAREQGGENDGAIVFRDVDWVRRPVNIVGHGRVVQNRLRYSGAQFGTDTGKQGLFTQGLYTSDEWFELSGGRDIVRFQDRDGMCSPRVGGSFVLSGSATQAPVNSEAESSAPQISPEAPVASTVEQESAAEPAHSEGAPETAAPDGLAPGCEPGDDAETAPAVPPVSTNDLPVSAS